MSNIKMQWSDDGMKYRLISRKVVPYKQEPIIQFQSSGGEWIGAYNTTREEAVESLLLKLIKIKK